MDKGLVCSVITWQSKCWQRKCFTDLLDHVGKSICGPEEVYEGRDLKPCFLNSKWKRNSRVFKCWMSCHRALNFLYFPIMWN